ncbi:MULTISPECIES: glycosyltransferase family A protein [Chryseobacterium]|uniref:glycosyltransferase family 2 protein n=1 Tax=Chryseobacterium TaxID=59732 RepID=UPI001627CAA4|nr:MULTISPECIES: glycosyltransferase family A protein [Chryseobacterium]MDM1556708.1 glycosyltransferase family 2 protein [Chryseobacterium indologenes]
MLITIFTPAYNRASLLKRLYDSLCRQEAQNFEWVVVDDGSSDNTEAVVKSFMDENIIKITYHKQTNAGKHIAINKGAELANGELFFIVDSDDYLTDDATKIIVQKYKEVEGDERYAGISGRKGYSETEFIGSQEEFNDIHANALDFRYTHGMKGDMAEVIRTEVIRKFPFPVKNEKFCTEGVLWFRVALEYKFLWFNKIIYIAEYLEGGLSNNIFKIRKNSPEYATLFYSELSKMPVPVVQKVKASMNYWRFAKFSPKTFSEKWNNMNPLLSLIGLPLSLIFLIKDPK